MRATPCQAHIKRRYISAKPKSDIAFACTCIFQAEHVAGIGISLPGGGDDHEAGPHKEEWPAKDAAAHTEGHNGARALDRSHEGGNGDKQDADTQAKGANNPHALIPPLEKHSKIVLLARRLRAIEILRLVARAFGRVTRTSPRNLQVGGTCRIILVRGQIYGRDLSEARPACRPAARNDVSSQEISLRYCTQTHG